MKTLHAPPGFSSNLIERPVSAYRKLEHLEVVLKVSERCNLKCSYCYFFFAGDESWKDHPVSVSLDTIEQVAIYLRDVALNYQLAKIKVILHGGEPLLVKKDNFRKILRTFRAHETPDFSFVFFLQTNAVLIDDGWVDIFADFAVSVGVSVDGRKDINDLHRVDTHGRSSYDDTVAGLRKLQEANKQRRLGKSGLICVVNPKANGAETYRHFVDDLKVDAISFRLPNFTHDHALAPDTIENINRFMLDALTEWFKDANPAITVRQFQHCFDSMLRDDSMHFSEEFGEDYRNIMSISSNGNTGPEDGVRTLHKRFAETGLNVGNSSFHTLESTQIWDELREAASKVPDGCQGCVWWRICKGGPLVTRWSSANGFNNPSIYCEGLKQMYAMTANALIRSGIPLDEIESRLLSQKII